MDEFVLNIDPSKFRSTNGPWNELMLNDPWSVGYVTTIIEYKTFIRKEEWEELYYKTGSYRDQLISENHIFYSSILNNESMVRIDKNKVFRLPYNVKQVNYAHGRTRNQLYNKAEILYAHMKDIGANITVEECFECVRFRIICETWNGVILRERNTVKTLEYLYPHLQFKKVSGETDHKYAIDVEVYDKGVLKIGLQIKPKSYLSDASYISKAKHANTRKNRAFYDAFGVNIINVISQANGEILNFDDVKRKLQ